ncbi:MAG: UDP-N-acetylmuramate:L-alanyl-gamma-D-glutamyl-meso-diaminopimelate ligase [Proteobacteria bacterium SG_bin7]|nr:MAG: UDP-N-acetylmuramate:L-alanyl-gamma-D-glutamyl-meso-diaminopimelate ligase [Proteobacteria bacterium SG_bin7]
MQLKKGSHIHFIGICGTAMASLAGILKNMGYVVTGSDENVYPPMSTQLNHIGIEIKIGYKSENLAPKPDLVVVGNVITKKNPEAIALLASDIPYKSLPDLIGSLVIGDRDSYVVSGTHGKTTTTSLLAWMAEKCHLNPGFLIGGIPRNFSNSFRVPKGNVFVIEGDEYDTAFFAKVPKFIFYKPKFVILTSIEFDHADIYKDLDAVKVAFKMLLEKIPNDGVLVANEDDENIRELVKEAYPFKVVTYGEKKGNYKLGAVKQVPEYSEFEVIYNGKVIDRVKVTLFGTYNLLNALACYAVAQERGWQLRRVHEAMASFEGVKRRQEVLGQPDAVWIIEDFAHHPTAVRLTVTAIQKRFPNRKVFSVFEPRSASSRRKVFEDDYIEAFSTSHEVVLSDPFNQSNIDEKERLSSDRIVRALNSRKVKAQKFSGADAIVDYLGKEAKPKDVILIMSNGAFDGIYQKLIKRLENRT